MGLPRATLSVPLSLLVGCATSAPPVASPPVPPVAVVVEPAEVEPVAAGPSDGVRAEEDVFVPGLGAEAGAVVRRSVYETARVAEWELPNGLRVVYAWDADADGYAALLRAPLGWRALASPPPSLDGDWGPLAATLGPDARTASGQADRLSDLLDAVADLLGGAADEPGRRALGAAFDRPSAFTLFLHGRPGSEWVEGAVAGRLGRVRGGLATVLPGRDARRAGAAAEVAATARASWDDWPSALVLGAALEARGASLREVADGQLAAAAPSGAALRAALAPLSDAEARGARGRVLQAAASPSVLLRSLAYLYSLPGEHRPARAPSAVRDLAGRLARTPPDRVDALRARLAAAPAETLPLPPPR